MTEAKTIQLTAQGCVKVEPVSLPPLTENQVRLCACYTGVNHAVELYHLQFSQEFGKPMPQTWGCGKILEIGSAVADWQVGEVVVAPMLHQTYQNVESNSLHSIRNMKPEFAIFSTGSITALHGIHCSPIRYGDRIAVTGMGTVGMMTLQYGLVSGATHITAFDPILNRLETAKRLGAHDVYSPSDNGAVELSYHLVFECSGNDEALLLSASLVANQGSIVMHGNRYTHHILHRVRRICEDKEAKILVPHTVPVPDLEFRALRSLQTKQVIVWPIPFHTIPFEEAPSAYQKMQRSPDEWIQLGLSY